MRHILMIDDTFCLVDYGLLEGRDIFFFNCVYYVFLLIDGWLAISSALYETLLDHLFNLGEIGGFFMNFRLAFNIISISVPFIIWKERNMKDFYNKTEQIISLG